jgi:hypothetical protein
LRDDSLEYHSSSIRLFSSVFLGYWLRKYHLSGHDNDLHLARRSQMAFYTISQHPILGTGHARTASIAKSLVCHAARDCPLSISIDVKRVQCATKVMLAAKAGRVSKVAGHSSCWKPMCRSFLCNIREVFGPKASCHTPDCNSATDGVRRMRL